MHQCEGPMVFQHLGDYPECQSHVTRKWDSVPFPGFEHGISYWLCDLHYREAERRYYGRDPLTTGYRNDTEWGNRE